VQSSLRAKSLRALLAVAQARESNAWLRIGGCALTMLVALPVIVSPLPIYWLAGLVAVVLVDRTIFQGLAKACAAGEGPSWINGLIVWTALQSAYGNSLAAALWFAPHPSGDALAIMFLCGGLANAAATLRPSAALSIAGVAPTIAFLLGLPVTDFFQSGDAQALAPVVAGMLLLVWGAKLWRSLIASDAALAQAEAAAARERLAEAATAAAKTDMIRRMNNELRTPMAALTGAAEHLHRVASTPQARAHIATLAQAGDVLKLVLGDLSDLDRIESGKLPIAPMPVDPRDVLRGIVSAFRAAAQDKNLELFLDVARNAPSCVEMDALRVRQVLSNLLANAVHHTQHGGVRVSLLAHRGGIAGRARLSFVIADTGRGMSRAHLASIFGGKGLVGGGDGFGLAISHRLARLMGGQILAKSELGQGSEFSFVLEAPVVAAAARSVA
jgi:signal transduction histidine kinase